MSEDNKENENAAKQQLNPHHGRHFYCRKQFILLNLLKKDKIEPRVVRGKDVAATFADQIWDLCMVKGYQGFALNTPFWQDIKNDSLDPDQYGKYNVQDVAYCFNSADAWKTAATRALETGDKTLAKYLIAKYDSNLSYAESLEKNWGVKPDGVIVSCSAETYMEVEDYVTSKMDPNYCAVVNYACYRLWPWLANEVVSSVKQDTNVYYDFVTDNLDYGSANRLEVQINSAAKDNKIDKDTSFKILANCIVCETNMFAQATTDPNDYQPIKLPYPENKTDKYSKKK